MKTTVERFWGKVDKAPGHGPWGDCWLWTGATNDGGYGKLTANGSRVYRAHRFSYELVHGRLEPGMCALHRCDIRRCVNPYHLFEGTVADNNRDTSAKGRIRNNIGKGSDHPQAVLNEQIVDQIWYMRQQGIRPTQIARTLGFKYSTISNVLYSGYWSHISERAA